MSYALPSDLQPGRVPHRSQLADQYGLSNFSRWRLSKEFASQYPFLDCTTGKHGEKIPPRIEHATNMDEQQRNPNIQQLAPRRS